MMQDCSNTSQDAISGAGDEIPTRSPSPPNRISKRPRLMKAKDAATETEVQEQVHPGSNFCSYCAKYIVWRGEDDGPPSSTQEDMWKNSIANLESTECHSCKLFMNALPLNFRTVHADRTISSKFEVKARGSHSSYQDSFEIIEVASGRLYGTLVRYNLY